MMSNKANMRQQAREARQERQAKRVITGIISALVLLCVLGMIAYATLQF